MNIHIVNGPNLNMLDKRKADIYGGQGFNTYLLKLQAMAGEHGATVHYYQSNGEGELIDYLQGIGTCDGVILNAGAYTHTSLAIADCVEYLPCKVIEVHISNVHAREQYRRHSYLAEKAYGVIAGFGLDSYKLALYYLLDAAKGR